MKYLFSILLTSLLFSSALEAGNASSRVRKNDDSQRKEGERKKMQDMWLTIELLENEDGSPFYSQALSYSHWVNRSASNFDYRDPQSEGNELQVHPVVPSSYIQANTQTNQAYLYAVRIQSVLLRATAYIHDENFETATPCHPSMIATEKALGKNVVIGGIPKTITLEYSIDTISKEGNTTTTIQAPKEILFNFANIIDEETIVYKENLPALLFRIKGRLFHPFHLQ